MTELTDDERAARISELEVLQASAEEIQERIREIKGELRADNRAKRERARAEGVET